MEKWESESFCSKWRLQLGLVCAENEVLYDCLTLLMDVLNMFSSNEVKWPIANFGQMNMEVHGSARIGPQNRLQMTF